MQRIAEEEFDEAELFDTEGDVEDTIEQACEQSDDEQTSSSASRNAQHPETTAGDHGKFVWMSVIGSLSSNNV